MKHDERRPGLSLGAGVAIGAGVGAALFAATGGPVWIGVGVALGAGLGVAAAQREDDPDA